uniref:Uncharacterized protein n=1 Tax=Tanacetum cinerariifolium TaxID=118510 RepID=A0A6L2JXL3_TANCI|nr:hypothetical protein [Tanacetum cinerariifolium]
MSDHKDETITAENAPPKNIPQIITVTNISAKFPYLKKGEYDNWAMKMQNFISNFDLLCWHIIPKGNSTKSITIDNDDEHIGDFYHMIDARDIWNAIKARFGRNAKSKKMQKSLLGQKFDEFKVFEEEGLAKGYDKMYKILTQMNTVKIKPDPEDINMKFLRGLPSSWSDIALIIKTKEGLEYISFDDLYNKLKFLEIDTIGYSSRKGGYGGHTTTLSATPGFSSSKGSSKSKCSVVDDVIYSFFVNHEIDQQLVYEDLDQMKKDEFEEYIDLRRNMDGRLSLMVEKMHGLIKAGEMLQLQANGSFLKRMSSSSIDWDKQTEEGNTDPRSLENFGMLAGIKLESDADSEGEVVSANDVILATVSVSAGPVAAATVSPHSETEFPLMGLSTEVSIPVTCPLCCDSKYKLNKKDYQGQREQLNDCVVDLKAHKHAVKSLEKQIKCHQMNQLAYEEKIRVLSYKLEEKSNILEYRQKLIDQATQEKQDLMTKLDNKLANQAKWNISGKNLYKLIDSSMSIRTKQGLVLDKYIGEVIDCARQEDFPSVCTSSIKTNVKSSKTLCNKFSYLHLIKDCDFHEQRFAKRNAEGKGKLGKRPTRKPVTPNRLNPVFVGQQNIVSASLPNPVYAGQPNPVSVGNGILGP